MGQVGGEICYFTPQLRARLFFTPTPRAPFYYSFACPRRRQKFSPSAALLVVARTVSEGVADLLEQCQCNSQHPRGYTADTHAYRSNQSRYEKFSFFFFRFSVAVSSTRVESYVESKTYRDNKFHRLHRLRALRDTQSSEIKHKAALQRLASRTCKVNTVKINIMQH